MTDRDEQLELLTAYLDGEATDAERAEAESLLAKDPTARALLNELRQTVELVAGLPRSSVPGDFSEGVVARLEREALLGVERGDRRRWSRGNWSALAASILLVVAAGWWILPQVERMRPVAESRELARSNTDVSASRTDDKVVLHMESKEFADFARDTAHTANATPGAPRPRGGAQPEAMVRVTPSTLTAGAAMKPEADVALSAEADNVPRPSTFNCVAVSDAAEVDQCLNTGRLTPISLVNADADAFTNRILVEVPDDKAVPILGRVVEANFSQNDVPNIDDEPKDKPLGRTQRFYARQDIEGDDRSAARTADPSRSGSAMKLESAPDGPVRRYVLNAPRGEVAEVVAAVQMACAANGFDTNYDINGCQFDNNAGPAVVTGNLVSVVDDEPGDIGEWLASAKSSGDVFVFGDSATFDDDEPSRSAGHDDRDRRDAVKKSAPETRSNDASADDETGVDRSDDAQGPKRSITGGASTTDSTGRDSVAIAQSRSRGSTASAAEEIAERARSHPNPVERVESNFVGPLPIETPGDSDIVTCVVTIRPMGSNRGESRRGPVASPRVETVEQPAAAAPESTTTTSAPTTTRPAEGTPRG